MNYPLVILQRALLDMLSTQRLVDSTLLASFGENDWATILSMVRQHRLGPLLHWRVMHERADLTLPPAVLAELEQKFRQAALRSLNVQRELFLVHQLLDQAGIPHIALKGAFLAFHTYPHAALRPLRDLDILVPEAEAMRAFQYLLDHGFQRMSNVPGDPAFILDHGKHLPGLRSAAQITIELHARISKLEFQGVSQPSLCNASGLWERVIRREIAGNTLSFFAPTDLLLHLIYHAAYDHQFDNGPLIFSDIAYLLTSTNIDWPNFWQRAHQGGWQRGCFLALKITEHYYGHLPIEWRADSESEQAAATTLAAEAALLSLRDFAQREQVNLQHFTKSGKRGWLAHGRYVCHACFPSRQHMARCFNVPVSSVWIYALYPYRLVLKTIQLLRGRLNRELKTEAEQLAHIAQWLRP